MSVFMAQNGRARASLGKNPTRSRDHNRRIILDLLRQTQFLRRKDLAQAIGLSGPAVANILEDLLSEGLILDMGRRKTGRGQPPLQFALNPKGAHTLGFEISLRGVVAVMLDLVGQPVSREILSHQPVSVAEALALIRAKISTAAVHEAGRLLGIGIVRPSVVSKTVCDPTGLQDWDDLDKEDLSAVLGYPVWLENDANAAALSEALFGVGAQLKDMALLYFGEGLGLGAMVGGRILRGARGQAGEIGHIVVVPNGKPCSCGQRGCLERYLSRHALGEALSASLDHDAILALWQRQDPQLLGWIEAAAVHLSQITSLVENLLDPETIVLSGQFPAPVFEDLIAKLTPRPSVSAYDNRILPRIQVGHAGIFTAASGAAVLPFYDVMSPQDDLI